MTIEWPSCRKTKRHQEISCLTRQHGEFSGKPSADVRTRAGETCRRSGLPRVRRRQHGNTRDRAGVSRHGVATGDGRARSGAARSWRNCRPGWLGGRLGADDAGGVVARSKCHHEAATDDDRCQPADAPAAVRCLSKTDCRLSSGQRCRSGRGRVFFTVQRFAAGLRRDGSNRCSDS